MAPRRGYYLSARALNGLKNYKYHSTGPFDDVMILCLSHSTVLLVSFHPWAHFHGIKHTVGYTILDVIHTPLWEWITNRLPMWLAPNTITLTGLIGVILSFLLNSWFIMDYQGTVWAMPRSPADWVFIASFSLHRT